jgi:ribosome maturation protein Sdo1
LHIVHVDPDARVRVRVRSQVAREREELEQKVMGISKEVTMWQGKYKAVLRACEQMEQELLRRSR